MSDGGKSVFRRTIVLGDIQGCSDQLDELLRVADFRPGKDRLVSLGDLVDKGPDSVGVVRRFRELKADVVCGNHEARNIKFRLRAKQQATTGRPNKMQFSEEEVKEHFLFSDDDIEWMSRLPTYIVLERPEDGMPWVGVHAGFTSSLAQDEWARRPLFAMEAQTKPDKMMRVRVVDDTGESLLLNEDGTAPEGGIRWPLRWKGPENVLYGHAVYDLCANTGNLTEQLTQAGVRAVTGDRQIGPDGKPVFCFGIDSGCCYGGFLTAAVLPSNHNRDLPIEFIQVPGKQYTWFRPAVTRKAPSK